MKELVESTQSEVMNFTRDQIELIKNTVARGATDDELKLFLHRAKGLGLDPLKPGLIHFVKYKNNPGTMIIGIDGFRAIAASTGLHTGTKRGLTYDSGKLVGAWAEVYRKDWEHPARDEVLLSEYSTGQHMWQKMPATMIKKVAEVAALRMAFSTNMAGLYSHEEMDQATSTQLPTRTNEQTVELTREPKKVAAIPEVENHNGPTEKQLKRLFAIAKGKGYSVEDMRYFVYRLVQKESSRDLDKIEYETVCDYFDRFTPQELKDFLNSKVEPSDAPSPLPGEFDFEQGDFPWPDESNK